jgi:hypothetical protein
MLHFGAHLLVANCMLQKLHIAGQTQYRTSPDASVPAPLVDVDVAATSLVAAATMGSVRAVMSRKSRGRGKKMTRAAFESELGVQAPVGFWDPLGLSADGDLASFKRRRETELKHGRLSMLATMGYITPTLVGTWPAYLSPSNGLKFSDVPNGLGALSKVPLAGWAQVLIYCAFVEVSGIQNRPSDAPGDLGWKVLTSDDPEAKTKKLSAEIANGRLAMMAIIGMFFQDGLTGSAWGDWANYTESPLRAFENELGVQEPVGFWDPLGLLQMATQRHLCGAERPRSSMAASACWQQWDT